MTDDIYTGMNCFNCGTKFRYEEGSGKLSGTGRRLLRAFGVPDVEVEKVLGSAFFAPPKNETITLKSLTEVSLVTPPVALPDHCLPLGVGQAEDVQEPLIEYLLGRKIDPIAVNAHFSLDPKFERRVIIPFYRGSSIIYWQARHIDKGVKPRYISAPVSKNAVLYGYDQLMRFSSLPLFVTEGIFDAAPLNGVALLGSSPTPAQLEVLKQARRRLVFVIDRDRTGEGLALVAEAHGWEVTFVDQRVADVNESLQRFGAIYTVWSLLSNISSPRAGSLSRMNMELQLLEGRLRKR